MATVFIPTPELCETIKALAYTGMSKENIADMIGRDKNTVFYNSEEISAAINSAYTEGKEKNKKDLLEKANKLTDNADSDAVKLNAIKYNLAIKHKVIEKQQTDITSGGKSLIGFVTRAKE